MNITSRIFFNINVINLKKTKNKPNDPRIIDIDNNVEPKSRCSKFCMNFYISKCYFTLITYLFNEVNFCLFNVFKINFGWLFKELVYKLEFITETILNILELSLISYIGIVLIILGLIVRVELKFSMQRDL